MLKVCRALCANCCRAPLPLVCRCSCCSAVGQNLTAAIALREAVRMLAQLMAEQRVLGAETASDHQQLQRCEVEPDCRHSLAPSRAHPTATEDGASFERALAAGMAPDQQQLQRCVAEPDCRPQPWES